MHLEKAKGADGAMSTHIERTVHPKNADRTRTHLNRELVQFPEGVRNRTQAIAHRIETAGIKRKIGTNQVRAIRVLLTGSNEDMKRMEEDGRLDGWCSDNLKWLRETYGERNLVSAVLHMDEKTPHNVIDIMEEQKNITNMGGTMRLGAYECVLRQNSRVFNIYKKEHIQERHRHRYEFNNDFLKEYERSGMQCVGRNPESDLVEIVEIPGLKWYIGTQFHPEYQSTVLHPHPLFVDFVKTAIENKAAAEKK